MGQLREVLSPHKIAVLLFIEKYSRLGLDQSECCSQDEESELSHEERRCYTRLLFKLVTGEDMSFPSLCGLVESTPVNLQHIEQWKKAVQQMTRDGIDGMFEMFETISRGTQRLEMEPWPCIWTSVVGFYLRTMSVLFKRLSFTETVALHSHFIHHCNKNISDQCGAAQNPEGAPLPAALDITMSSPPASPSLLHLSPDTTQDMTDNSRSSPTSHLPPPVPLSRLLRPLPPQYEASPKSWSLQGAERLISRQSQMLQHNPSEAMPARQLQETLTSILTDHPSLSAAHYLSSLNYLRVGEVRGAVDSLTAAYDCHQVSRSTARSLRYASLNLAAVYSHFGSWSVAQRCVQEAISQSQEAADHTCLQHSLAWMYSLASGEKQSSLITSAVQRTSFLQLGYLNHLAVVNQAAHSEPTTPAHHLQLLTSRMDSCSTGLGNYSSDADGTLWSVLAGVWSGWWGDSCIATAVYSQVAVHTQLHSQPGTRAATSNTAAALCSIATALAHAGEYRLCHALLHACRRVFQRSPASSRAVRLTHAHVSCTHHSLRGEYARAKEALTAVTDHNNVFLLIRSCEVAIAQGEAENALQKVTDLLAMEEVQEQPRLQVQAHLLHAAALCTAGTCSAAVQPLVHAVTIAKTHYLALLHAIAILTLAALRLQLNLLLVNTDNNTSGHHHQPERPNNPSIHAHNYYDLTRTLDHRTLDDAMSVVASCGGVYERARALLLMAKLRVLSVAKKCPHKLAVVAADLQQVKEMFTSVDALNRVRDTLYLSARLYHAAGHHDSRNRCALELKTLEHTLLAATHNNVPPTPVY